MSLENQDVFQLLKEVTFRRILVFYTSRKWGHLCISVSLLQETRYCFLAIYVETNIFVYESLLL